MKLKIESSNLVLILTLVLLGFLFYWPSLLGGPTFIDDDGFIFEFIPLISSKSPLHFWNYSGDSGKSWPLSYTAFWTIYRFFQDTYWVYKLINLCLHILNSYLIVVLFKNTLSKRNLILASIIYLIHPIQIETVSWIFQLNTIMATSFFLLSYKVFLTFLETRSVFSYAGAIYLFLFSLLSKVSAIILPFLFLFHALQRYRSKKLLALLFVIPFFTISLYKGLEGTDALENLEVDTRLSIDKEIESQKDIPLPLPVPETKQEMQRKEEIPSETPTETIEEVVEINDPSEEETSNLQENVTSFDEPVIEQESEFLEVWKKIKIPYASFSYYISHFLLPIELSIIMPDITKINFYNVFSWILTASLIILLFLIRKKMSTEIQRLILFLILSLVPILGFIFIPFMNLSLVADHWFYLGMIPTSLLFMHAIESLKINYKTIVAFLFLSGWSYQSLTYVHLFNHKFRIIEKAIEILPSEFRLRMELATALLENNKLPEAQRVIEKALVEPRFENNIILLLQGGYIDRQLKDYEKLAQKIHKLGMIYIDQGDLQNGKFMLQQLKEINSNQELIKSLEDYLTNNN